MKNFGLVDDELIKNTKNVFFLILQIKKDFYLAIEYSHFSFVD